MGRNPRFKSDARSPGNANWSSEEDWTEGENTGVGVAENGIVPTVTEVPLREVSKENLTRDSIGSEYGQARGRQDPPSADRIELSATQGVNHASDESLKIKAWFNARDEDYNVIGGETTSVVFGPGTTAGTTKTSDSYTFVTDKAYGWSLGFELVPAPTTSSPPDEIKIDAWVGLY